MAEDRDRGLTLFEDLARDQGQGEVRGPMALATYGALQAEAAQSRGLAQVQPRMKAQALLTRVQALADGNGPTAPGNAFALLPARERADFQRMLHQHGDTLELMARALDTAPATINHTDLRRDNMHLRADGTLCLFDWDDAIISAPGWSLHNPFGGVTRLYHALRVPSAFATVAAYQKQRQLVEAYMKPLIATGLWTRADLVTLLPQAALFGVLKYIDDMAPYDISGPGIADAVRDMAQRRLGDVAAFLSANGPGRAAPKRSAPLPQVDAGEAPPEDLAQTGARLFADHGALLIRNCIDKASLSAVARDLVAARAAHKAAIDSGGALRVGDRRYMVSLSTDGALGTPQMLAAPALMPLLERLLGAGFVLGSLTTVLALGGAKAQHLHRDNSPLFPDAPALDTPPFSIAAIIPLVPITAEIGTTEIHLGTHKPGVTAPTAIFRPLPEVGDCYLMDSRVMHRGLPNQTKVARPILSLVYQRPWYRDYQNFTAQETLSVSADTLSRFLPERQGLIAWARRP